MKVENLVLNVIIVDGKVDNIGEVLKKHISDIVANSNTVVINGSDEKEVIPKNDVAPTGNTSSSETHAYVGIQDTSVEKNNEVVDEVVEKETIEEVVVKNDETNEDEIVRIKGNVVKFAYYSYVYSNELAIYALLNKGITADEFAKICPELADKNLADLMTMYSHALIKMSDIPHDVKFRIDMNKVKKVASTSEITASILDVPAGCVCEITHNGIGELILLRLNSAKNAFCNYGDIKTIFGDKLSCITVGGVSKKHKELFPNSTVTKPVYF